MVTLEDNINKLTEKIEDAHISVVAVIGANREYDLFDGTKKVGHIKMTGIYRSVINIQEEYIKGMTISKIRKKKLDEIFDDSL